MLKPLSLTSKGQLFSFDYLLACVLLSAAVFLAFSYYLSIVSASSGGAERARLERELVEFSLSTSRVPVDFNVLAFRDQGTGGVYPGFYLPGKTGFNNKALRITPLVEGCGEALSFGVVEDGFVSLASLGHAFHDGVPCPAIVEWRVGK